MNQSPFTRSFSLFNGIVPSPCRKLKFDLETNLRSQLSATQAQLEQAQELIANLQDQIESLESTMQTPLPEPVMEEAEVTEEAAEETPEVSDAEAEAILLPSINGWCRVMTRPDCKNFLA